MAAIHITSPLTTGDVLLLLQSRQTRSQKGHRAYIQRVCSHIMGPLTQSVYVLCLSSCQPAMRAIAVQVETYEVLTVQQPAAPVEEQRGPSKERRSSDMLRSMLACSGGATSMEAAQQVPSQPPSISPICPRRSITARCQIQLTKTSYCWRLLELFRRPTDVLVK